MISVLFLKDRDKVRSKVRIYCILFAALAVIVFTVNLVQHYNFAVVGELLAKRIRQRMLSKILTFEVGWFDLDQHSSGIVCSKLTKEPNVIRSLVGDRVSLLVECLSGLIITVTLGIFVAWQLAIVLIAVQPLMVLCFYTRKVVLKSVSGKSIKAQNQGSQAAFECVTHHKTIAAFCSQQKIIDIFDSAQAGPRREINKQSWCAGLALGTSKLLEICYWPFVFWYGGRLIGHGVISFHAFLWNHFIFARMGRMIADAGSMTSDLAKGSDAVTSVFEILDRNSLINPEDHNGVNPEKVQGSVALNSVDFAYPARPNAMILRNFCLKINAGSSFALVGKSGCGKSTIVGLIERFYDPLKGTVLIDGQNIRNFNLRCMRQHIALVGQEPTLFARSIGENIAYGKENASEAEIVEAAKAANAHEFISCLKDGYETYAGNMGTQMSGGQKQRIAIARAIIKNPKILLLDEATSALDAHSENVVQEALDRVTVGRTTVVVAHRLTSIQNADCIAVIEGGRVLEQGNHSHLLAKGEGGIYFGLIKLQQQR
jgi:ATP-binding cassette subfamily B (MDR/TAP) protein 1